MESQKLAIELLPRKLGISMPANQSNVVNESSPESQGDKLEDRSSTVKREVDDSSDSDDDDRPRNHGAFSNKGTFIVTNDQGEAYGATFMDPDELQILEATTEGLLGASPFFTTRTLEGWTSPALTARKLGSGATEGGTQRGMLMYAQNMRAGASGVGVSSGTSSHMAGGGGGAGANGVPDAKSGASSTSSFAYEGGAADVGGGVRKQMLRERNRLHARNSRERKRQKLGLLVNDNESLKANLERAELENDQLRGLIRKLLAVQNAAVDMTSEPVEQQFQAQQLLPPPPLPV